MKKIFFLFLILFVVICASSFGQSFPTESPLVIARAAIPDVGLMGYSGYRVIKGIIDVKNCEFTELATTLLVSDSILFVSSTLQVSNNLFVNDPKTHKRLLWATRIGYLASIATSIIWGIADPDFEGEDRMALGVNCVPAAIGFGLTFLPYPNHEQ